MNVDKIIFLDFDGVITTPSSNWRLSKDKLDLLENIINETDCGLVISSSWRRYNIESTIERLKNKTNYFNNGMEFPFCDRIMGVTKHLIGRIRGEEIEDWLQTNNYQGKYVILDDDPGMLRKQKKYFVKTSYKDGLTEEDVKKVINKLNG